MLAPGTEAPDFSLRSLAGEDVSLREVVRENKAVLVNFWFCGCTGCREELPHVDRISKEFASQGFEVLAVNMHDTSAIIEHFLDKLKVSVEILTTTTEQQTTLTNTYGQLGYPANFLVGADGRVIRAWSGFSEQELRAELGKLGIK
jgi:peroxiredoxin